LERIAAGKGPPIVGISQDGQAGTDSFRKEFGLTFPLLMDSAREGYPVSNMFRITNVPTIFVVTPDRKVEWAGTGFSRADLEELGRRAGITVFRDGERTPDFKPG
jgi:peroxiredoxin